tara:strand:- start:552 stop:857 length:306 start_codon:yes stop_codon:yes gene_type:complete
MIIRSCIRCKKVFEYEGQMGVGRGKMTRRYCDMCKILQHRDEARINSLRYGKDNRKSQYMKEYYQKNKEYFLNKQLKYGRDNREELNRKARLKYRSELQKL